jgi:flagellar biosynthesis protein FlhF
MTADVGRAGAIDQIKAYGDALGADFYITETPHDVANALRQKRPTGAVVLDTPGISPYDPGDFAALRSFQEATHGEAVLVLPASGDVEEFKDWAAAFREFGARRIMITKFDATRRVGGALTAAFTAKLALAHFSQTPFISEGLIDATPEFLARRLLAGRAGRLF